jgi:hypothetical protein
MRLAVMFATGLMAATITRAVAAEIPLPSVSFVGEGKTCAEAGGQRTCWPDKIHYTPQRFRIEQDEGADRQTALYDLEKKTVTKLDFGAKTYTVSPLDPQKEDFGPIFVAGAGNDYTRAGEEAIGGTPTVKYVYSATSDGQRSEIVLWVSADNIVRRVEATRTGVPKLGKVVSKFEATKVAIGAFDPKLLELAIPSDFKKAD